MKRALQTLLFYMLLALLGVVSLAWNVLAVLLYPVLPRATGRRLGRHVITSVYRWYWATTSRAGVLHVDARALDGLSDEPGLIVVANHPSLLDALILVSRLPRSACIMKASLMRNVFLGAGARLARYIRNDSPRGMIRLAVQDLHEGGQLVLFPEGTRTVRTPINAFRPGVTLIAKLAAAPIQTVFIDTDSPYLGKGWPLGRRPPMPIVFSVRLGERFAPRTDTHAALDELERYFAARCKPQ